VLEVVVDEPHAAPHTAPQCQMAMEQVEQVEQVEVEQHELVHAQHLAASAYEQEAAALSVLVEEPLPKLRSH